MDAEQHYGILGMYAGVKDSQPILGGDANRWQALRQLQEAADAGPEQPRRLRSGPTRRISTCASELPVSRGRDRSPGRPAA